MRHLFLIFIVLFVPTNSYSQQQGFSYDFRLFEHGKEIKGNNKQFNIIVFSLSGAPSPNSNQLVYANSGSSNNIWRYTEFNNKARKFLWLKICRTDMLNDTMNIFFFKHNKYEMYNGHRLAYGTEKFVDTIAFHSGNYIIKNTSFHRPTYKDWLHPEKARLSISIVNESILGYLDKEFPFCSD